MNIVAVGTRVTNLSYDTSFYYVCVGSDAPGFVRTLPHIYKFSIDYVRLIFNKLFTVSIGRACVVAYELFAEVRKAGLLVDARKTRIFGAKSYRIPSRSTP